MRQIQIAGFAIGVASFLVSLLFIGSGTGDILWRAGVAIMASDIVCIQLWPAAKKP